VAQDAVQQASKGLPEGKREYVFTDGSKVVPEGDLWVYVSPKGNRREYRSLESAIQGRLWSWHGVGKKSRKSPDWGMEHSV
jgi:hypothetical protein